MLFFSILYTLIVVAWLAKTIRHVVISIENKESPQYITVVRYAIVAVLALAVVQVLEYLYHKLMVS